METAVTTGNNLAKRKSCFMSGGKRMYSGSKRTSMFSFCLLCVLLIGMCLGTMPADSFLEYTCVTSFEGENPLPALSIQSPGKSTPSAQIFEHRAFGPCEAALSLRHTAKRHSARPGRTFGFVPMTADIFSLILPYRTYTCCYGIFHEIFSNTVIINYIHRQDGQKASSLFFP